MSVVCSGELLRKLGMGSRELLKEFCRTRVARHIWWRLTRRSTEAAQNNMRQTKQEYKKTRLRKLGRRIDWRH